MGPVSFGWQFSGYMVEVHPAEMEQKSTLFWGITILQVGLTILTFWPDLCCFSLTRNEKTSGQWKKHNLSRFVVFWRGFNKMFGSTNIG